MNSTNDFLKQHKASYRKALKDIVENNTNALVDEDIKSLLKKPPLDSMDLIKGRLISSAKKNKIVLNTDNLNIIDKYREKILMSLEMIKKIRNDKLFLIIDKYELLKDSDTIKINKKDFNDINKKIKSILKDSFSSSLELLLNDIDNIFMKDLDLNVKKKIVDEFTKYMKGKYQKQLLENIDIKILIKDTTFINIIKEQGDRYIFTINNSRLLNNK